MKNDKVYESWLSSFFPWNKCKYGPFNVSKSYIFRLKFWKKKSENLKKHCIRYLQKHLFCTILKNKSWPGENVPRQKTFSQLWHRWKPSLICGIVGSVQVFWQFVSHWVVGFPGHYTTPHQTSWPQCGNNHMHDFTYSCSCFAQEFECSATEPQKNQILCSASKELNLHKVPFWDNGNYLLVADFYSLYGNNFLFFEKFNKNLYQHLAKPTTTQALHKAWWLWAYEEWTSTHHG